MTLHELASADAALAWFAQRGVRALAIDSRRVAAGDAFIAWPGYAVDGRQFVPQALAAGASACLVEAEGADGFGLPPDERVAALRGLKASTGLLASRFMGAPSESLNVVGCTGTNGKTSMAWWTAQALSALGRRCGVVGTLGVGEPPTARGPASIEFTGLTTPDPVTLQVALRAFVDAGFEACAVEASSIGLVEYRLVGTRIVVALFSNFTQDHLDYHGSMDAYWLAKSQLFTWPGLRAVAVNVDDEQGRAIVASLEGRGLDLWTYSTRDHGARLRAANIGYADGGLGFEVHEDGHSVAVRTGLIGDYNVSNVLAVIGGLRALGVRLDDAARACAQLTPVPGRMQRVVTAAAGPQVVVDYAHTPDALEKALLALRPFAAQRGGKLWCLFGCGGNRDATKRPLMGALAQRLAQQVVITSDNPRSEASAFILLQIVAGLAGSQERVKVIEDRRAAIAHAVRNADVRDVILIAGKGHENYQEIRGVKHHFSDVEEAGAALALREATAS
jgi:UDP-N-acetylmuramoyl-L-alanyl-D-glutamate--2,6-diaminopimelate ligase